jgi:hypothetical protein
MNRIVNLLFLNAAVRFQARIEMVCPGRTAGPPTQPYQSETQHLVPACRIAAGPDTQPNRIKNRNCTNDNPQGETNAASPSRHAACCNTCPDFRPDFCRSFCRRHDRDSPAGRTGA